MRWLLLGRDVLLLVAIVLLVVVLGFLTLGALEQWVPGLRPVLSPTPLVRGVG